MRFDVQLFAEVEKGDSNADYLRESDNNTQIYGLAGNDTIESSGRNAILIGGSGNDVLRMTSGNGTLSGGAGNDTFGFNYPDGSALSAVIEDIDPVNDRIVIDYGSSSAPAAWNYSFSGRDMILSDSGNRLNITIRGTMPLDEYYDSDGNENIWGVLEEVNEEREKAGLAPLTLSKELMSSAAVRSKEIVSTFSHTRPDGTPCYTALENNVGYRGENIAAGQSDADDVMNSWMNSPGHRANILNSGFGKIGIGYHYDSGSYYGKYWVQMFRSYEYSNETLSADELLSTKVILSKNNVADQTLSVSQLTAAASVDDTLVIGTDDDDTITNRNSDVTINAGKGNDTIKAAGSHLLIEYKNGDGNDLVLGYVSSDTISIIDDSAYATMRNVDDAIISIGAGSITLKDAADMTLNIIGGSNTGSDDTITNSTADTLIVGSSGNDTINNLASNVTVNGNDGDDYIFDTGYSYHAFNNNYFFGGAGNDTINNWSSSYSLLDGGEGNDSIKSDGRYMTVNAGAGNDSLDVFLDDSEVFCAEGNDYAEVAGNHTTVNGGAGNDTVYSDGYEMVLNGDAGNDSINNASEYFSATIDGGGGNDTLLGSDNYGDLFRYAAGDGKDVIINYGSNDTISIIDDSAYTTLRNGDDAIISIGAGSITLKDAADKTLNIIGGSNTGSDDTITNSTADTLIVGSSGDDTINNLASNVTINGNDGDDYIFDTRYSFHAFSNNHFFGGAGNDTIDNWSSSYSLLDGGAGDDSIKSYGRYMTVNAGAGNDSLDVFIHDSEAFCAEGNDYAEVAGNRTTLNGGVGDDTVYSNGYEMVLNGDAGNDSINNVSEYFSATLNGGGGNDTLLGSDNYGDLFRYAAGDGRDVIINYGSNDTISIIDDSAYTTMRNGDDAIISIGAGSITLKDAADMTLNIIGGTPSIESLDAPSDTVPATIESNVVYVDENTLYLNNARSNVSIVGNADDDTIYNDGSGVTIVESEGENLIVNYAANVTMRGGEDDDNLITNARNVLMDGGDGDDTLTAYGQNPTMIGGDGDDIFQFGPGSASSISVDITDLNEEDTLKIISTNTKGFSYSLDNGKMTLKDNTKKITLTLEGVTSIDQVSEVEVDLRSDMGILRSTTTLGAIATLSSDGTLPTGLKLNSSGKTLTIKTPFEGTIYASDYGNKIKTLNASSNKNAVSLIGNGLDNVLKASKGGGTLEGGGGKDKITCGNGADVIVYADGDGKDTIKKFDGTQDKIRIIDGSIDSVKVKGKNVVLNIGAGSMTVQKAVGQDMTLVDESGVESTYRFTKQNNTLEKALISTSTQLPTEDYWFDVGAIDESPLSEILSTEASEISFAHQPISDIMLRNTTTYAGGLKCKRQILR